MSLARDIEDRVERPLITPTRVYASQAWLSIDWLNFPNEWATEAGINEALKGD